MPVWIDRAVVLAIHDEQLSEHGGLAGIRDAGALDSALGRPQNLHVYEGASVFRLAAAYAFGLACNHAFADGNKRTSAVVTELFLEMNGWSLTASDEALVMMWLAIADGQRDESTIAAWLEQYSAPNG